MSSSFLVPPSLETFHLSPPTRSSGFRPRSETLQPPKAGVSVPEAPRFSPPLSVCVSSSPLVAWPVSAPLLVLLSSTLLALGPPITGRVSRPREPSRVSGGEGGVCRSVDLETHGSQVELRPSDRKPPKPPGGREPETGTPSPSSLPHPPSDPSTGPPPRPLPPGLRLPLETSQSLDTHHLTPRPSPITFQSLYLLLLANPIRVSSPSHYPSLCPESVVSYSILNLSPLTP